MRCIEVPITTSGTGTADVDTPVPMSGTIAEIRGTGEALNNAGKPDVTITRRNDGAQVLKLANTNSPWSKVPQQPVVDNEGAAALFAAGGTAQMEEIPVDGYLRVQVAEGVASKTATIFIYVDEE